MRAHASWGSQDDAMLVFLNQDAYDKYCLSKEDYELRKELEAEQKKAQSKDTAKGKKGSKKDACLLYTSPSPRDGATSRMPSSA